MSTHRINATNRPKSGPAAFLRAATALPQGERTCSLFCAPAGYRRFDMAEHGGHPGEDSA